MPILTEIKLIFSIAVNKGPCFGVVLETVLITQECFVIAEQGLHSVKPFSASHIIPPRIKLWVHKEMGGDTAGAADPKFTKEIFHTI